MAQRKPSFPEFGFVRLPQILACIPICESAWWEGCRTGSLSQAGEAWPSHHSLARRRYQGAY